MRVWPAASTAVEAYVYYSFLARMVSSATKAKYFALGGWVQTSSILSPVATLVQDEARRQLRSECFNCGSKDHYASKCTFPLNGCTYRCPADGCRSSILVTSRGQTPLVSSSPCPAGSRSAASSSGSQATSVASSSGSPSATKRVAASSGSGAAPIPPAGKRQKLAAAGENNKSSASARGGREVLAINETYTSLSWYLCNANPTPKQVAIAKDKCSEHALELQGGHTRSLDTSGFVALPPSKPKSLTDNRTRLGTQFVATALKAIKIRRAVDGEVACRLSQVLFRVLDLQSAFGS